MALTFPFDFSCSLTKLGNSTAYSPAYQPYGLTSASSPIIYTLILAKPAWISSFTLSCLVSSLLARSLTRWQISCTLASDCLCLSSWPPCNALHFSVIFKSRTVNSWAFLLDSCSSLFSTLTVIALTFLARSSILSFCYASTWWIYANISASFCELMVTSKKPLLRAPRGSCPCCLGLACMLTNICFSIRLIISEGKLRLLTSPQQGSPGSTISHRGLRAQASALIQQQYAGVYTCHPNCSPGPGLRNPLRNQLRLLRPHDGQHQVLQLHCRLASINEGKGLLPDSISGQTDRQIAKSHRTTAYGYSSFSYRPIVSVSGYHLLIVTMMETDFRNKGERIFHIKLGDQIVHTVDIVAEAGFAKMLHKGIEFDLRDDVVYVNGTLPALNAFNFRTKQVRVVFESVKNKPKVEGLVMMKGSDSTQYFKQFLQSELEKNVRVREYLSEKYRKQPKLPYKPLMASDVIPPPDSEIMKILKKYLTLRSLGSILCGILAIHHEKIIKYLVQRTKKIKAAINSKQLHSSKKAQ